MYTETLLQSYKTLGYLDQALNDQPQVLCF